MLSSIIWRGQELNDGVNYYVDTRDSDLLGLNTASADYAQRITGKPVLLNTKIEPKEIPLSITVSPGTDAQIAARVQTLRFLFSPDGKEYSLKRKRPAEQYYRSLKLSVKSVSYNELERRFTVILVTTSAEWEEEVSFSQTYTLFTQQGVNQENRTLTYDGGLAVEPVLEITSVTAGQEGLVPKYYRKATVWITGANGRTPVGVPLKLIENWNIQSLIQSGKMLPYGEDTIVTYNGQIIDTYYIHARSSNVIDIWIVPPRTVEPLNNAVLGAGTHPSLPTIPASATPPFYTQFLVSSGVLPSYGEIYIRGEKFSYDSATHISGTGYQVRITGRGLNGTPNTDCWIYDPIRFPVTFQIEYGWTNRPYLPRLSGVGWPPIDYASSTNFRFDFTGPTSGYGVMPPNRIFTAFNLPLPRSAVLSFGAVKKYVGLRETANSKLELFPTQTQAGAGGALYWNEARIGIPIELTSRAISKIRMIFSMSGVHPFDQSWLEVATVLSGLGTDLERRKQRYAVQITQNGTLDTGEIFLNQHLEPASAIVASILFNPLTATLQSYYVYLDGYGVTEGFDRPAWPIVEVGSEIANHAPFNLTITNNTTGDVFTISGRMYQGEKAYIDCFKRTVSGGLSIVDVSYTKDPWLRLTPGNNSLTFSTTPGRGQMAVKIIWKRRY